MCTGLNFFNIYKKSLDYDSVFLKKKIKYANIKNINIKGFDMQILKIKKNVKKRVILIYF